METRLRYVAFTTSMMASCYMQQRVQFKVVQVKLRTVKVMGDVFNIVLELFRNKDTMPVLVSHSDSAIDRKVKEVWNELKVI